MWFDHTKGNVKQCNVNYVLHKISWLCFGPRVPSHLSEVNHIYLEATYSSAKRSTFCTASSCLYLFPLLPPGPFFLPRTLKPHSTFHCRTPLLLLPWTFFIYQDKENLKWGPCSNGVLWFKQPCRQNQTEGSSKMIEMIRHWLPSLKMVVSLLLRAQWSLCKVQIDHKESSVKLCLMAWVRVGEPAKPQDKPKQSKSSQYKRTEMGQHYLKEKILEF